MKTLTKLKIASYVVGAMMFLNLFSHPLHLSEGIQFVLILGVFIPIRFVFIYTKKLKEEKAQQIAAGTLSVKSFENEQTRARKRLIILWIFMVPFTMSFPFWLPSLTGVAIGRTADFLVSIMSLVMVSLIFGYQLRKLSRSQSAPTPAQP